MSRPLRPLFRADAVQHYAQSKEKIVLPRFILPVRLVYLWALLGLCVASSIALWLIITGGI